MQLTFMCIFKYLNKRVISIGGQNGLSFKGVSKRKKKKKMKRLSIQDYVFTTVYWF